MKLINQKEKIFIAGATGMVGNAIKIKLYDSGYKNLITPSRKNLDLTNSRLVFDWFKKNKPDIVILCAAKVGGILKNMNFLFQNTIGFCLGYHLEQKFQPFCFSFCSQFFHFFTSAQNNRSILC